MLHKTTKAIQIKYAKISKTGKRSNNEDAVKVITTPDEPRWMGIVCDGMGGHAMGETASETVIDAIAHYWQETTAPRHGGKSTGSLPKGKHSLSIRICNADAMSICI